MICAVVPKVRLGTASSVKLVSANPTRYSTKSSSYASASPLHIGMAQIACSAFLLKYGTALTAPVEMDRVGQDSYAPTALQEWSGTPPLRPVNAYKILISTD